MLFVHVWSKTLLGGLACLLLILLGHFQDEARHARSGICSLAESLNMILACLSVKVCIDGFPPVFLCSPARHALPM